MISAWSRETSLLTTRRSLSVRRPIAKTGFSTRTTRRPRVSVTSSRASGMSDHSRREAAHGFRFGAEGFEHRQQLRDDEQIVDALGQVQQLQGAALPADRRERAHDFANPGAVDVRHVPQIEEEVLASLVQQAVNLVFEQRIPIAERQFAYQIQNGHASHRSFLDLHLNPPIRVGLGLRWLRLQHANLHQHPGEIINTPVVHNLILVQSVEPDDGEPERLTCGGKPHEATHIGADNRRKLGDPVTIDQQLRAMKGYIGKCSEPISIHLLDRLTTAHRASRWTLNDAVLRVIGRQRCHIVPRVRLLSPSKEGDDLLAGHLVVSSMSYVVKARQDRAPKSKDKTLPRGRIILARGFLALAPPSFSAGQADRKCRRHSPRVKSVESPRRHSCPTPRRSPVNGWRFSSRKSL